MGDRWNSVSTLHGCAAGNGTMGTSISAGGAIGLGRKDSQRYGLHPLWRTRYLGLCREVTARYPRRSESAWTARVPIGGLLSPKYQLTRLRPSVLELGERHTHFMLSSTANGGKATLLNNRIE